MKRALAVLLVTFSFFSANAQNNILKFNLMSFAAGTANVAFEKKISEGASFQLRGFYTDVDNLWLLDDQSLKGYGIIPELRVYFSKNSPSGFYAAPFLKYQNLELTIPNSDPSTEDTRGELVTFGGGLITGVHWIFGDVFSLDLFLGPSYNFGDTEIVTGSETEIETGPLDGFGLRSGFTIGFVF